ncbi:integrase [Bifidobacterium tsurumiense]|uniref:Integrase n=2 Tax=Bifidobacterium tsurumiense TaxID=356829 RepID=A0A087EH41_9BIFI|nr:integrase [Bifidobacterium tsurumiense]
MVEHPETERVDPIADDVRAAWRDSRERHGVRKTEAALAGRGVVASRRRIGNIMKRHGMASAYARRTSFRPCKQDVNEAGLANLLDREFSGYRPHTHLASGPDVRGGSGADGAYVCLPMDLANRAIAGHCTGTNRTADLVLAAFATLEFPLTDVEVFHTDRAASSTTPGSTNCSNVRHTTLPVPQGEPYDNAVVETTNRLLKKELIYRNHYSTIERLRSDPDGYVWWFNNQRLHSTLGYRSPNEFTQQGLVLQETVQHTVANPSRTHHPSRTDCRASWRRTASDSVSSP